MANMDSVWDTPSNTNLIFHTHIEHLRLIIDSSSIISKDYGTISIFISIY
jgi:hypothetical protein